MGHILVLMQRDEGLWPLPLWESRLGMLDAHLHDEILRFRWPEDRQQRVVSRLLLREGLRRWNMDDSLASWRRDVNNRPLLAPTKSLPQPPDFSCSHTRGLTVVALGKGCRLGVDVESIRPLNVDMLDRIFSKAERAHAEKCPDPQTLVELWTRKEALLKGDGSALTDNPHKLEVLSPVVKLGQQAWHVQQVPVPQGFICHAASSDPYECELEVQEVPSFEVIQ